MAFDFDAAVTAPFRMQPGLRRLADGATQLTPLAPGSRHQREKLAVLSTFAADSMIAVPGFDAGPALQALCTLAAAEHPEDFGWDGNLALARRLGVAASRDGRFEQRAAGAFGLGDEITRCLEGVTPDWRLAALLSLAFAEDFAMIDGRDGTIPWLAVLLPSFWAPAEKVGRHFTQVHAPVADNTLLLKAAAGLIAMVTGPERWERFVWTITPHSRLHAHPAHVDPLRWADVDANRITQQAWFRSERQTFIAVPDHRQAVFTIAVDVRPLLDVAKIPGRAKALHGALATMSPGVLDYRGLTAVHEPLLRALATLAR